MSSRPIAVRWGPRLAKDDQAEEYLRDLDRMIKRARRRLEREQGGTS